MLRKSVGFGSKVRNLPCFSNSTGSLVLSTLFYSFRYLKALSNLALLEHDRNNLARAEELYRRVIDIDPHHRKALRNLGDILDDR